MSIPQRCGSFRRTILPNTTSQMSGFVWKFIIYRTKERDISIEAGNITPAPSDTVSV